MNNNILSKILKSKTQEIKNLQQKTSLDSIQVQACSIAKQSQKIPIQKGKLKLIAEVKHKSPSKGIIRQNFDYLDLAKSFSSQGAYVISVLTEAQYFGGSIQFLKQINDKLETPLLQKDFIISSYQIYQARVAGASLVLLIQSVLKDRLKDFIQLCLQLQLRPLIEVHTLSELQQALAVIKKLQLQTEVLLGINNRNLNTFEVDIDTGLNLLKTIKQDCPQIFTVAESGFFEVSQLQKIDQAGFDAVLIGEGLAKNPNLIKYFN